MSKQVTFSIADSMVKLGKTMKDLSKALEDQLNMAIKDAAYAAYAKIQAQAQAGLSSTRKDYLKALSIDELGSNTYLIALDSDWANALEGGFPSFNQTPGMMASTKTVEVGRRAGQPWVQTTPDKNDEKGHKYAYVPFERQPGTKEPKYADLASQIQEMTGHNIATQKIQKLTDVFKDELGSALQGLVAMGKSDNAFLNNLAKYQTITKDKSGKESVQSTYINYRCVSEIGKPWIHPGFSGLGAFQTAEKYLESQIDQIVQSLLGS